ncbi:tyrosine-type recombinase/integrase [Actinosynnema sp. NPDC004786]
MSSFVTDWFAVLAAQAGLPPIRLHDLRHGAATLALAAGVEMKTVREMPGHSSITVTSDTYSTVLPEVARNAAEAIAGLVTRRAGTDGRTTAVSPRNGHELSSEKRTNPLVGAGLRWRARQDSNLQPSDP